MLLGSFSKNPATSLNLLTVGLSRSLSLYNGLHQTPISTPPLRLIDKKNKQAPIISLDAPPLTDKEKLQLEILDKRDQRTLGITMKDFTELTKFKLSVLNTTVAAVAYVMTSRCVFSEFLQTSYFLIGTQTIAMSSQCMNQAIEFNHDVKMKRTASRPVPLGKFTSNQAKGISLGLMAFSNLILLGNFGWEAAAVANAIFGSYIFIYTPMKKTSTSNTHWGAAVGAAVPYLGWMAGGGAFTSLPPLMMALFIFSWQYPHFYGILWTYKDDYRNGGFKMIEDPERAGLHVKLAFGGYLISLFGLVYAGTINPYLTGLSLYHMYKYGWKPGAEFQKNPTIENAKKMKYGSYVPFTIFFALLLLGISEKVYLEEFHFGKLKKNENEKEKEK